jgi:CBS domain-containing protein
LPTLKALDLVRDTPPVTATPEETLQDAIRKMASHNIGSIAVVDDQGRIVGIVTERDVVALLARHGPQALQKPLKEVMTRDLVTASPEEPIPQLAQKMIRHGIRHIPVVDENRRVVGVVSIRRILRHILAENEWP